MAKTSVPIARTRRLRRIRNLSDSFFTVTTVMRTVKSANCDKIVVNEELVV
jgi:hypothetical protein